MARLLVVVTIGIFGLAGIVSSGPKAVVKNNTWDFGKVPNFGHVAHTFTIYNDGDAVLRIDSIKTECGCTTTNLGEAGIPPGGQRGFQMAFNAGVIPKGGLRIEKGKVFTNDPRAGVLTFSLTIQVVTNGWEMVEVTPTVIEINGKRRGEPLVQVKNRMDETLKIAVVETSGFLALAGARTRAVGPQASGGIKFTAHVRKGVDTRGPVPRAGGRPMHSSVTFTATGTKGTERFTIPSELAETARARLVQVDPN
jgi:hypothetical protein